MARTPTCLKCGDGDLLVIVYDKGSANCASCGNPITWRESGDRSFTLNVNDRRFLKSIRIAVDDEHEVNS